MARVRVALKCRKPLSKNLKGVLYSRRALKGAMLDISTAIDPKRDCLAVPRFPSFESILGVAPPDLHETWVSFEDAGGTQHRYLIAAQYRADYEVNRALRAILPEVSWRGDLIVMRGGMAVSVVGMKYGAQRQLADRAVRKFLVETAALVTQATQNNIPLVIPDAI